uniref:Uncharacterized protein n=1 Tax=Picea sitchensis TaxID=3332 RepID=B8LQT6_PICSI|nr:unknown [Picea sitchensis]
MFVTSVSVFVCNALIYIIKWLTTHNHRFIPTLDLLKIYFTY